MRFHGRPGEDWMGHVDALEIHRANKFRWTARQFYYGLRLTLQSVALTTANSLEEELVEINLLVYLPDWFQAEMTELRSMIGCREDVLSAITAKDQIGYNVCILRG